jgi:maltose O-acetyltransferase
MSSNKLTKYYSMYIIYLLVTEDLCGEKMIVNIAGKLLLWYQKFYLNIHIKNGLKIGKNVFMARDVFIDPGFPWLITIGDNCTITSGVMILAHDASTKMHIGYTKIGKIIIGNNTYIGVNSIILPNVNIGDNVIIGAGSVVTKNIPPNSIALGNPAKIIGSTSDFIEKHKERWKIRPTFKEGWTLDTGISEDQKEIMKQSLEEGIAYVL